MEVDEIEPGFGGFQPRIVNPYLLGRAAVFEAAERTRVIDEHLPHEARGNADEVGAILPVHAPSTHQPEKRLVHELGRLQRMTVPFAPHIRACEPAQLGLDERHQAIESGLIAVAPRLQQLRDFLWCG
jgi:hypothetical protein